MPLGIISEFFIPVKYKTKAASRAVCAIDNYVPHFQQLLYEKGL